MSRNAILQTQTFSGASDEIPENGIVTRARWHVLWTHSNCEQLVHDQLEAKGFELFLPKIGRWARRGQLRYVAKVPMFPGYLFIRQSMDKASYIEVCKARGLARVLGDRWDRLAAVPDAEIESIQKLTGADLPAISHPYLRKGQRVRVTRGPLAHSEGILLNSDRKKGLLVLSVDLLRRSVAVQIDCTWVAAA